MSHVHRQDSSRERAPWSRRPSVASTTTAVSSSSEYSSALPLPFCADDESEEKAPTSTSTSPSSIVPPPPDHHHHHHFPARRQDDLEVGSSCSSSSNGSSSSDYHRCSMASSCHVVARDLPYVSHTTSLLPSTPNRTHPATPLPQDPLLAQSSQLQQQQWEGGAGGAAAVVMISSLPNSSLLSLPSRPYLMGLGNDHKPFNGSHKAKQSPEKEEKEEDGEKESTNLVATVGNDGPTPVRNEGGGSSSPSSSTSLAVATLRGASRRRSVSIAESAGRGTTTTVPPVPVQSLTLAELDIMSRAALIDHIVALQGCHQNGATCPQPPPPPPVATPCNGIVLPSQLQSQDPSTLPVLIVQQEEEQQPQQQQKQRITLFQPQKQIGLEFDASLTTPTPIPLQSQSQLEGMEAALMDKSTSPATTPPSPASGRGLRLPPTLTMHEFAEKSLLTDFAANLNLTPVASAAWLQPVTTTGRVQKAVDDDGSKLINDYVVLQELGRGAFGKVKLAYDPHHCRMVAIKIVRKPSGAKALRGNQQDEIATLQREIAVMKKLRHKNIVNLYEVIDDPEANKLYLVMRYVDNGPIGKVETDLSSTRYPPEELLPLATNVINGLYYLHARNIVHRDIKPENILVSSDGEAFLADFGVSEMFEREAKSNVEGKRGTKLFMAPELLNSTGNAVKGRALDIWALGVTLFALLTGRMPFSSAEEITDATKPDFSPLPAAWVTMIKGMLHRDAEKRLSVHHLRQHIKRIDSKQRSGSTNLAGSVGVELFGVSSLPEDPDAEVPDFLSNQSNNAGLIEVFVTDAEVEIAMVPKNGNTSLFDEELGGLGGNRGMSYVFGSHTSQTGKSQAAAAAHRVSLFHHAIHNREAGRESIFAGGHHNTNHSSTVSLLRGIPSAPFSSYRQAAAPASAAISFVAGGAEGPFRSPWAAGGLLAPQRGRQVSFDVAGDGDDTSAAAVHTFQSQSCDLGDTVSSCSPANHHPQHPRPQHLHPHLRADLNDSPIPDYLTVGDSLNETTGSGSNGLLGNTVMTSLAIPESYYRTEKQEEDGVPPPQVVSGTDAVKPPEQQQPVRRDDEDRRRLAPREQGEAKEEAKEAGSDSLQLGEQSLSKVGLGSETTMQWGACNETTTNSPNDKQAALKATTTTTTTPCETKLRTANEAQQTPQSAETPVIVVDCLLREKGYSSHSGGSSAGGAFFSTGSDGQLPTCISSSGEEEEAVTTTSDSLVVAPPRSRPTTPTAPEGPTEEERGTTTTTTTSCALSGEPETCVAAGGGGPVPPSPTVSSSPPQQQRPPTSSAMNNIVAATAAAALPPVELQSSSLLMLDLSSQQPPHAFARTQFWQERPAELSTPSPSTHEGNESSNHHGKLLREEDSFVAAGPRSPLAPPAPTPSQPPPPRGGRYMSSSPSTAAVTRDVGSGRRESGDAFGTPLTAPSLSPPRLPPLPDASLDEETSTTTKATTTMEGEGSLPAAENGEKGRKVHVEGRAEHHPLPQPPPPRSSTDTAAKTMLFGSSAPLSVTIDNHHHHHHSDTTNTTTKTALLFQVTTTLQSPSGAKGISFSSVRISGMSGRSDEAEEEQEERAEEQEAGGRDERTISPELHLFDRMLSGSCGAFQQQQQQQQQQLASTNTTASPPVAVASPRTSATTPAAAGRSSLLSTTLPSENGIDDDAPNYRVSQPSYAGQTSIARSAEGGSSAVTVTTSPTTTGSSFSSFPHYHRRTAGGTNGDDGEPRHAPPLAAAASPSGGGSGAAVSFAPLKPAEQPEAQSASVRRLRTESLASSSSNPLTSPNHDMEGRPNQK